MKPISTQTEALLELEEAANYFKNISHNLGEQFVKEFEDYSLRIQQNPYTYADENGDGIRLCPMKTFPYAIVYRIRGTDIQIIALANHKRRPNYWANRLNDEAS